MEIVIWQDRYDPGRFIIGIRSKEHYASWGTLEGYGVAMILGDDILKAAQEAAGKPVALQITATIKR